MAKQSSKRTAKPPQRRRKPITADKQCQAAKPEAGPYRLAAGRGLSLQVMPNGGKWWRFRYRYAGKQKMLSLGTYPDVSLKRAREKRDAARRLVAEGVDPSAKRKAERTALSDTLEAVAREWVASGCPGRSRKRKKKPLEPATIEQIEKRIERYVYPHLGNHPVRAVDSMALSATLKRIEADGKLETAHRVANYLDRILLFAKLTGRIAFNPAEGISGTLSAVEATQHAAVTDRAAVGELLRKIDAYNGQPPVVAALRLLPYVFVRSAELRGARWEEIDLDAGEWRIPAARMKMREAHIVPLSKQAVAILRELHTHTGRGTLVFPGLRPKRPISENTLNTALRAMGYRSDQMTTHGFRTMASTRLNEMQVNPDLIEVQLAHLGKDGIRKIYNRAKWLPARRKMMQKWANFLDGLRTGATVTSIHKRPSSK